MVVDNGKRNKPPYLLGLLVLIPLVGFFVGIALILYGIFKYKDKILVFIGAAGIVITVGVYSLLYYSLNYSKSVASGFAKISQVELDQLVKSIEFYKLENGQYPDSLQQLQKGDDMVSIVDPLLIRKADKHATNIFQYKKYHEKYTLFSAGVDAIPHTKDDIYPSMLKSDSTNKLGLIKE